MLKHLPLFSHTLGLQLPSYVALFTISWSLASCGSGDLDSRRSADFNNLCAPQLELAPILASRADGSSGEGSSESIDVRLTSRLPAVACVDGVANPSCDPGSSPGDACGNSDLRCSTAGLCTCGNGTVDPGEECDGGEGCDSTTCRVICASDDDCKDVFPCHTNGTCGADQRCVPGEKKEEGASCGGSGTCDVHGNCLDCDSVHASCTTTAGPNTGTIQCDLSSKKASCGTPGSSDTHPSGCESKKAYEDADGDGFGNPTRSIPVCVGEEAPPGYTFTAGTAIRVCIDGCGGDYNVDVGGWDDPDDEDVVPYAFGPGCRGEIQNWGMSTRRVAFCAPTGSPEPMRVCAGDDESVCGNGFDIWAGGWADKPQGGLFNYRADIDDVGYDNTCGGSMMNRGGDPHYAKLCLKTDFLSACNQGCGGEYPHVVGGLGDNGKVDTDSGDINDIGRGKNCEGEVRNHDESNEFIYYCSKY